MGRPNKALLYSQLDMQTAQMPSSGHKVQKCTFKNVEGLDKKIGFYKPLDDTYPEILAKLSVGVSVFMRLILGERAAEDRLVFDDNGRICGTVSIGIPGFKPFDKEKHSTETLLQANIMELLVGSWFLCNDDLHPGNLGLDGIIDYDMFLYYITVIIKGERVVNGWLIDTPPDKLELSVTDFQNFPVLKDAKCTHYPTKSKPDNLNYAKAYPGFQAFVDLAKNYKSVNSSVTSQEQLFTAVLKILLTYQPDVLKKRLEDAFGDLPLNHRTLDKDKVGKLENKFSMFFSAESNKKPFVDMLMSLYQHHYDNLYRTIVFFSGCPQNVQNASVPAFCDMLHSKPSFYKNINEWMGAQNKLMANEHPSRHFDLDEALQRYLQVWMNSYAIQLRNIVHKSFALAKELRELNTLDLNLPTTNAVSPTDASLTSAVGLFSDLELQDVQNISNSLTCDLNSDLRKGLIQLLNFNNQMLQLIRNYFAKPCKEIFVSEFKKFSNCLQTLILQQKDDIPPLLGANTSWGPKCVSMMKELQTYCINIDFPSHLISTDESTKNLSKPTPKTIHWKQHTESETVNQCIISLFNYADSVSPQVLTKYITGFINNKYNSTFSNRNRGPIVTKYITTSEDVTGANRLGHILSTGNAEGALNTILVKELIKEMLKSGYNMFSLTYPSIQEAFDRIHFDETLYTNTAVLYAKKDKRFFHIGIEGAPQQVHNALYLWVNAYPLSKLEGIVKSSLNEYEKGIGYMTKSRRSAVEKVLSDKTMTNAKKLAHIFIEHGWESNSLNYILFVKLVTQVFHDKAFDGKPEFKMCKIVRAADCEYLMETAKSFASKKSHEREEKESTCTSSSTCS